MSHHAATCFSGDGTCRVGRAIIDDEGAISSALDVGDDARDHRRLIVGGDDNAYSPRLRHHRSSRNEEKPTQDQHEADYVPYRNGSAKTRQPSAGVTQMHPLSRKPAIRSASGPSPAPRSAGVLNSSWPPAV